MQSQQKTGNGKDMKHRSGWEVKKNPKADSVITGAYLDIHSCPKPTKDEALLPVALLLGQGSVIQILVSTVVHNLQ